MHRAGSHSVSNYINTVVCQLFTVTFFSGISFCNFCKISAVVTFHLGVENFALFVVLVGNEYHIEELLKTEKILFLAVTVEFKIKSWALKIKQQLTMTVNSGIRTQQLTITSSQISFNSFSIVFKYSLLISVSFFWLMLEMTLHALRRVPTTFLYATDKRFLSPEEMLQGSPPSLFLDSTNSFIAYTMYQRVNHYYLMERISATVQMLNVHETRTYNRDLETSRCTWTPF